MKIVSVVLTRDRPQDLAILLKGLASQDRPNSVLIVDAGNEPVRVGPQIEVIRSEANLGGAGGFSLGILHALARGADWVWMMDDDAYPIGDECLTRLLNTAIERDLAVISPIVVAPADRNRLAFPFTLGGIVTYDVAAVKILKFIPGTAQFFNGALIRKDVFVRMGLPDMKLFIRGDEVDFMLRLRRHGFAFGTTADAVVAHPPGWDEVVSIVPKRIAILIPQTGFKRYFFYRNRGYLARRYRRWASFVGDTICYPYAFIILQRGNWAGLREWGRAYWHGLTYKFNAAPKQHNASE